MSLKQMNTRFIAKTTFPSPNRAAKQIMYTIPVVLEKFYGRFLHHKRHVGLSRKARCQKPRHHTFDVLSKMNNPKEMKNPMNSIFSQVSFTNAKKSYPCGFPSAQIRFASSSSDNFVTNEAEFDTILHERDFEIHRHHRSPVSGIVKYGRNALTKVDNPKVLDIGSSPIDPSLSLVRDLPGASLCAINSSRDMLKIISDQLAEDEFQNISTELNDLANLSEFEDGWFDLVISCYGLHQSMYPSNLLREIHRVLRPGGTMITAVWEHLGTKPIVNRILGKMSTANNVDIETNNELIKPRAMEKLIEETGLKVLDIHRGEYPFYLSTADGLHSSAFDVVTLPIKKDLVELMNSGQRPYVFEDARAEFDDIVREGNLVTIDNEGRLIVENNRYKIIVARRQYEDIDREKDIEKTKANAPQVSKFGLVEADIESVKSLVNKFNFLLQENLSQVPNSPMKYVVDSTKQDVNASAVDESKVKIMDLASSPNLYIKLIAEALPQAHLYCTDFSPDSVEDVQNFAKEKNLNPIESSIIQQHQDLSSFETSSMDIITCSFGLTRFSNPESILKEVHRVLKPGGSFIASTWDSIALERIGDSILSDVLMAKEPHIPALVSNLASLSAPKKLERMLEDSNLVIVKIRHQEFPSNLGKDGEKETFENAIIPIHHLLKQLEESSVNPNAFSDARRVYDKMLKNHQLMWKDDAGNVKTVRNRYKFIIARRQFEDCNGVLDRTKR